MPQQKLSTDQKIDLILSKVTSLEKNQQNLENNQQNLDKNQETMQNDITKIIEMTSKTLQLEGKTADRVTRIEEHLSKKTGFTPFTSGAFAV